MRHRNRRSAMFRHFALTEVSPTITHANRQAETASRLVSRATKGMIICLAVLWNGPLLAAPAKDDELSKEYSECIDKSGGETTDMIEFNCKELDRQDAGN